jgi:hypothetical protein
MDKYDPAVPGSELPEVSEKAEMQIPQEQPEESLLAMFTPAGWGTAIQMTGMTGPHLLKTLKEMFNDPDCPPGVRLAVFDRVMGHTEKVLRMSGHVKVINNTETLVRDGESDNGERGRLIQRTSQTIERLRGSAEETEKILQETEAARGSGDQEGEE